MTAIAPNGFNWTCQQCGLRVPMKPTEFPIHCQCGLTETHEEAVNRGGLKDESTTSTRCQYLQGVKESFNGRWLSCGCSTIYLYPCQYFDELVTLHAIRRPNKVDTAEDVRRGISDFHPEYKGKTCQGCEQHAPIEPFFTGPLPIPTTGLSQDLLRGIITGANEKHWTCLGALAIAAHEQHLGFAVADHGLSKSQRAELDRVGVRWIEHGQPDLSCVKDNHKIISEIQAWWKPWVCLASPFVRSVWVDSDAAVTGDLSPLFQSSRMQVSTQRLWTEHGPKIYHRIVNRVFGESAMATLNGTACINSGVLAWTRGEPLLQRWADWCQQMINVPRHVEACRVRDQAGLMLALIDLQQRGESLPEFLADEYNIPADHLRAGLSQKRRPISRQPDAFLRTAKERHPVAVIVHWLGGMKPWKIQKA